MTVPLGSVSFSKVTEFITN